MSIEETRTKIKELCEKLGLDADKVLREYGVHHGVIEMLEATLAQQSPGRSK